MNGGDYAYGFLPRMVFVCTDPVQPPCYTWEKESIVEAAVPIHRLKDISLCQGITHYGYGYDCDFKL